MFGHSYTFTGTDKHTIPGTGTNKDNTVINTYRHYRHTDTVTDTGTYRQLIRSIENKYRH